MRGSVIEVQPNATAGTQPRGFSTRQRAQISNAGTDLSVSGGWGLKGATVLAQRPLGVLVCLQAGVPFERCCSTKDDSLRHS